LVYLLPIPLKILNIVIQAYKSLTKAIKYSMWYLDRFVMSENPGLRNSKMMSGANAELGSFNAI